MPVDFGAAKVGNYYDLAVIDGVFVAAFTELYPDPHTLGIRVQPFSPQQVGTKWFDVSPPPESEFLGNPLLSFATDTAYVCYAAGYAIKLASCPVSSLTSPAGWQEISWQSTDVVEGEMIAWDIESSGEAVFIAYADYSKEELKIAYSLQQREGSSREWKVTSIANSQSDELASTIDMSLVRTPDGIVVLYQSKEQDNWKLMESRARIVNAELTFVHHQTITSQRERGHMTQPMSFGDRVLVAYVDPDTEALALARRNSADWSVSANWELQTISSDVKGRSYLAAALIGSCLCIAYNTSSDEIRLLTRELAAASASSQWKTEIIDTQIGFQGFVNPQIIDYGGKPLLVYYAWNPNSTYMFALRN